MNPVQFAHLLVTGAILIFASILASKMSSRLGIPALLLFLIVGMLAGSEGVGGIYLDNPPLVQAVGIVALAFILFSGGLDTPWSAVRPVLGPGIALSSIGVILTAAVVSLFARYALGFSMLEGLLLGAIISSTDAAAVFSVLRSRGVRLDDRMKSVLELESGSNDPMAVFLTTAAIHYALNPSEPGWMLVPMLIRQMGVGFLAGVFIGWSMVYVMNRLNLESQGLYYVMTVATVAFTYGVTESVGGNGFLAVYVAGITMGNRRFVQRIHLAWFHDGLAWMMQISMFLILGLQVFPSRLVDVAILGLALSIFLMVIARPLAVYLSLAFFPFSKREKALLAWIGLRGAVPIILATYPLVAGLLKADYFFNLVFFVVLTSVLVQGTSIPLVARLLGLESPAGRAQGYPVKGNIADSVLEVIIPQNSVIAGKQLLELDIPDSVKVLLVGKGGEVFESRGSLVLDEGDRVLLFGDRDAVSQARAHLERVTPL